MHGLSPPLRESGVGPSPELAASDLAAESYIVLMKGPKELEGSRGESSCGLGGGRGTGTEGGGVNTVGHQYSGASFSKESQFLENCSENASIPLNS